MAILTASDYKTRSDINVSDWDTEYGLLIAEAEAIIARWCDREIEETGTDRTEYYDGTGTREMYVRAFPIVSITSLKYLDSVSAGAATYTAFDSDTYFNDAATGRLIRSGYADWGFNDNADAIWPSGVANIQLVYKGGYTSATIPADLKSAIYGLVDMLFDGKGGRAQVESDTIDAYLLRHVSRYRRQGL